MASRPLPEPTPVTAPFWEACKAHKLLLQQCGICAQVQFYPRSICTTCMSNELGWLEARGCGTVYSYSTVHRALLPGFEEDLPYVVTMIELQEGVRLLSQIVGCAPEDVSIGLAVEVVFEAMPDGIVLPMFHPAGVGPR